VINTTDTSERGLEALIEDSLINEAQYVRGEPADYDKTYCVDKVKLLRFLHATQPQEIAKLEQAYGNLFEDKFLKRLYDQVQAKGIVEVLRNGIKAGEVSLSLFYKRPASSLNKTAAQGFASNMFSITRQLRFSKDNTRLSLDIVIFINGLPVATFELKNSLTKQNVKDAIRQYQNDRDPKEPLFAFARCLVHFAVDDELVYMTTDLKGKQTTFLPFNKGFSHGAGNPVNDVGLKTDYLWKEILSKDGLSNVIEKYAQIISETDENGRIKRKLVFPRYHQLDLVRGLLADAKAKGAGQRYLIQHSAGSGKSHSITWLSHQLVELTDATNTNPVFDSVIVVTDRRALDKQIRDNIKQFAQVKGVVEAITEGSRQLREALRDGKKIIITTIQKFPFIIDEIGELKASRFAIVIDEAHSSQSGHSAAAMSVVLSVAAEGEEETIEDKINRIIESRKMLTNASYFAFTATPKNKTLETFGIKNPKDGKFYPCHIYSMKQAIEEEFILDVLKDYTTLNSYYKLLKRIEDDPQFDNKRAQKKLRKFVESHQYAIRQKAEIMIDHFIDEVIKKRKINGQAKAMVVTNSIIAAIRYKLAFDAYLKEIKSPFKAIAAFSGSKEDGGKVYDEALINGFPGADIPKEFKKNEYRFLIVAEKFQTGFDEPLLHTMYVDKPLSDIKAVQTLSRLNRAYKPYKQDTFVLDFVNSADAIKEAFEPYYKTTILSEETDLNRLNDLQDALDGFQVYSRDEVNELMTRYLNGAKRDQLDPILDGCKQIYKDELSEEQKIDFKTKAKSFVRAYQFLSQILPFKNVYWESLNTFLKLLITKLPAPEDEDLSKGLLESVDMDSYRVEQEAMIAIKLEGDGELDPTPTETRGGRIEPELDYLSGIINIFNERFGTDFTENDRVKRFLFEDIPNEVGRDEEYQNAKKNSDRQNAEITHKKKVENKFQEIIFDQTELYRKFTDDPEFKKWLCETLFKMDYDKDAA
jgi:type I restriction enzyme R subunit